MNDALLNAAASDETLPGGVGVLEHLTGPSRGHRTWLNVQSIDVALTPSRLVHATETRDGRGPDGLIARFQRVGGTFEIRAAAGKSVWVNGEVVSERRLVSGDMIELGNEGPLSRFRFFRDDASSGHTVTDILSDAGAYLRSSRQPGYRRVWRAVATVARRLTRETSLLFRSGVIVALILFGFVLYQQNEMSARLEAQIETGAERLERVAVALGRAQRDALTPEDLHLISQELAGRLAANTDRLAELERRSTASARVIAEAAPSVGFIQTAFGFRDRASGRMLLHALDADGNMIVNRRGQPALTLDGDGPVAEVQVTGTGFALAGFGVLLTNRHVALPWENDSDVEVMALQGLEPVGLKTVVYFPGRAEPIPVGLRLASENADLAILEPSGSGWPEHGLILAEDSPEIGSAVIVMGFPTGLRAMLAQSGDKFIAALEDNPGVDFWSVAGLLAEQNLIAPLSTRGIVGQVSEATVIYDAETTYGGSGGPVLDDQGRVVAVNAAILQDYGGSNIGVPVSETWALLRAAGLAE